LITTGIVLSNFKGFTRKSSLDLLAREMSLVIRQAQVYGTATKLYDGTLSDPTKRFPSYGIYAKKGANYFFLFSDTDKDGYYDGKKDECDKALGCVEQFNLYGGARISDLKGFFSATEESITKQCNASHEDLGLQITFPRPRPNAEYMIGNNTNSGWTAGCDNDKYSYAQITIEDPLLTAQGVASSTRDIIVWRTGHIYVKSELGN
jgi:hypothetical protein